MTPAPESKARRLASYWPHIGLAAGICLNVAGLVTTNPDLIGTGSNVLTVCGLFLFQRRHNEKKGDG
jgi:hypothetical protein